MIRHLVRIAKIANLTIFLLISFGKQSARGQSPQALESKPDAAVIAIVDGLKSRDTQISWISSEFLQRGMQGVLVANEEQNLSKRFDDGSALQVAEVCGFLLEFEMPPEYLKKLREIAKSAGFTVEQLKEGRIVMYPTILNDTIAREFFLLRNLEERSELYLEEQFRNVEYLDRSFEVIVPAQAATQKAEAALAELQQQIARVEAELAQQIQEGEILKQTAIEWGRRLDSLPSEKKNLLQVRKYDIEKDQGIEVIKTDPDLVPINTAIVKINKFDGQTGVSVPYLDRKLEAQLEKFFVEKRQELEKAGMADLTIESGARTPESSGAMRSSDAARKVKPLDSNHVIGTSVDFNGIDYTDPSASPAERDKRLKKFTILEKLLSTYGIKLGTKVKGKDDPVHATLNEFVSPNSPVRLKRLARMAYRYALRYSSLHEVMEAQRSEADRLKGNAQRELSLISGIVEAASSKCLQLQSKLKDEISKNAEVRTQIEACMRTYAALTRKKSKGAGSDRDRQGYAERIRNGEDVTEQLGRAYNDAINSCKNGVDYSRSRGPDSNGFHVQCNPGPGSGKPDAPKDNTKAPRVGGVM